NASWALTLRPVAAGGSTAGRLAAWTQHELTASTNRPSDRRRSGSPTRAATLRRTTASATRQDRLIRPIVTADARRRPLWRLESWGGPGADARGRRTQGRAHLCGCACGRA